jgi:hypothetical protein
MASEALRLLPLDIHPATRNWLKTPYRSRTQNTCAECAHLTPKGMLSSTRKTCTAEPATTPATLPWWPACALFEPAENGNQGKQTRNS